MHEPEPEWLCAPLQLACDWLTRCAWWLFGWAPEPRPGVMLDLRGFGLPHFAPLREQHETVIRLAGVQQHDHFGEPMHCAACINSFWRHHVQR